MGLDVYLWKGRESVEINSTLYPEHMFKIGYFRSSYNSGGLNTVLGTYGIPDLYGIFEYACCNSRLFKPNWKRSLARCDDAITQYRAILDGLLKGIRIHNVTCGPIGKGKLPQNTQEVFEIVKHELSRDPKLQFTNYGNASGEFYLEGETVIALVRGVSVCGPCMYVVTREESSPGDWYLQALEIIRETIQYVLAQPDRRKFSLSWSG